MGDTDKCLPKMSRSQNRQNFDSAIDLSQLIGSFYETASEASGGGALLARMRAKLVATQIARAAPTAEALKPRSI